MMHEDTETGTAEPLYEQYVNPQWVRLLEVLGMTARYTTCRGSELFTTDGRRILDFNSGYCVHNAGHNHPRIIEALKEELDRHGPAMLQGHVPELAGELAARLCEKAGGRLRRVYFASSGSEGIETVIKFSRANTRRPGILSATGAFHGLTCGALSLMSNPFWTEGFGPLLPGMRTVPFGDLATLEKELSTKLFAAFVVEPVQAEGGIRIPNQSYLQEAQRLCRRTGTLFVLDEVQTGLHRTGPFLAAHHFGVDPDMVVLAKALSGGLVPVSAVLMSEGVYDSVYTSFKRSIVHTSTFSENGLAMRAGLTTLEVLESEGLGDRASRLGEAFRKDLSARLARFEMVKEVRGLGMMTGIEFAAPRKLSLRMLYEAFSRVHPAMFGQVLVMHLFRDKGIFSQICGNHFMVLKASPALVVQESQLEEFATALESVVELMETSAGYWNQALGMVGRILHII